VWLYDLAADPTEKVNQSAQRPEKVAELQRLLDGFNQEQAAPLWPWIGEVPIWIDKTIDDKVTDKDEYIYWPN
jgi:uncharacterized sulfatase